MTLPNRIKTPALQQQYEWIAKPLDFMEKAVQQYPDIFTSKVVGAKEPIIFVNHPQGIQELFTNDKKKFISGQSKKNKTLEPLVGQYSVMLLDGPRHKRDRQ
ncbi:MAG: cytochrome P450, partial [Cyanobacteria bacterium P01_A01_bin.84]